MKIETNYNLHLHNGYRINAIAQTALFPETQSDLEEVFFQDKMPHICLLGRGNNIILSQPFYEHPIVILNDHFSGIKIHKNGGIEALCGTDMQQLSEVVAENGLAGLEVYSDIPSSVGGAIFMNASASGYGLEKVLTEVIALMPEERGARTFHFDEMEMGYRHSVFQENGGIILSAKFQLTNESPESIKGRMAEIKKVRHGKQPIEFPNSGSVFKRPPGKFVGSMLEALGLKGFRIGGAMISEKHAGFIVNCDNATGSDILMLIDEIKKRVIEAYGIELELEQRVI